MVLFLLQSAFVGTCIRLHNFCLETLPQGSGAEIETDDADDVDDVETNILPLDPRDEVHVQRAGDLLYGAHGRPNSLLDGGHHFDDVTDVDLRRRAPKATIGVDCVCWWKKVVSIGCVANLIVIIYM